ncbi:UNC93-like protein MFSD11 [Venturia canescens]|uniref:UNC93-like protein MFSD11 n=1 Tax=Venturia canescens TaxID=32260 RepID=UPI001C9C932C|nr:UNC93-like protein MFSD11 [Venturia canescens]
MAIDRAFLNVITLSFGFMLVFTAFQTMGNIEVTILQSITEDDPSFVGTGFTSLAIVYSALALCNWLAPSFISMSGPRVAIFTGCCCYVFFIGSFLVPTTELLYTASAILGFGAALIWTGHGQYLTENSNSHTMSRNASLFWAIFQSSFFTGNLFVYFMFTESKIEAGTRKLVFWVLSGLALGGTIILGTLRAPPPRLSIGEAEGVSSADKELAIPEPRRERSCRAAWHALRDAFKLFLTPQMLLLSLTFVYTGLALTFFSGVYSSSVGFTVAMGDNRKSLVGLSGICIGVGEVVGGTLFGVLASRAGGCSGWPVIGIGFIISLFAYITTFLNLPNVVPIKETSQIGYIDPSPVLAMIGSITLGFGDASFNTQIYSLLGLLYPKESAPAFALFKFCQSVAAALSFVYSGYLPLHGQLSILFVTLVLGTGAFFFVERAHKRSKNINHNQDIDPTITDSVSIED